MIFRLSFLVFFSLNFSTSLQATEGFITDPSYQTVVTAKNYDSALEDTSQSILVLRAEQIEMGSSYKISDALRGQAGVDVASTGAFGSSSFFLRGASSGQTLVLIDGVRINDISSPNSFFDASYINWQDVQKIEILKGPQSGLYGSDAMGGVINIILKKKPFKSSPQKQNYQVTSNLRLGSLETINATTSFFTHLSNINLNTHLDFRSSQGISVANSLNPQTEKDGMQNLSGDLGLQQQWGAWHWTALLKGTMAATQLDQFGLISGVYQPIDDPFYNQKLWQWVAQTKWVYDSTNQESQAETTANWRHTLSLQGTGIKRNTYNPSDHEAQGQNTELNWQTIYRLPQVLDWQLGGQLIQQQASVSYLDTFSAGTNTSQLLNTLNRQLLIPAIYSEAGASIFSNFKLSSSVRWDQHPIAKQIITYRFGGIWTDVWGSGFALKVNYGTGFKAPTLSQLYETWGNPNLRSERMFGFDAGFVKEWNRGLLSNVLPAIFASQIKLTAIFFSNDFIDLISTDANFVLQNIQQAQTMGTETELQIGSYVSGAQMSLSYTWQKAMQNNLWLPRRPEHKLLWQLSYPLIANTLMGTFILQWTGPRFNDSSNSEVLKAYQLLKFNLAYQYNAYNKIDLMVDNLLDQYFEEVKYYGQPGRAIYLNWNHAF